MPITPTVSGGQVGQTLKIKIRFTGTNCVPGNKWRLSSAAGVALEPAVQEIPAGAASRTLTWKSAATLPAGLTGPVTVNLIKEHGVGAGPTPVQTFQVDIQPAAIATPATPATPPAAAPSTNPATQAAATVTPPANPAATAAPTATPPALPQPLDIRIVGGTAASWINSAGIMGWLGALVMLFVVWAFLWVVLNVIAPTAFDGLTAPPEPTAQPAATH